MKTTLTLNKKEIDEAIRKYVLDKTGLNVDSVSLNYTKGLSPFDADYWSASVSCH